MMAIETEYNGYKFRSRLEARWAVFFDAMGIEYVYEPEGYEFEDGTRYLPDFKIYVRHRSYDDEWEPVYVEVKGIMGPNDRAKIKELSKHAPVLVVSSIPANVEESLGAWNDSSMDYYSFKYMDGDSYFATFSIYRGIPWICGPDHDEWDGGTTMNRALLKARKARFEYGQKGA